MNWPTTRLRYVADLNPGIRADLLQAPDVEVSFLPMDAIGEDGTLDLSRNRAVAEVRNGYSYFEEGDVAFAKVTPCFENGKGALMRGLELGAGFGTTEITVLRPKVGTEPRFLNYVLRSEQFRQNGVGAMTGAGGLKRVPDEFTRDFKTPWPTPAEQERIANFLDVQTARIDALIAEKERLISAVDEFRSTTISEAVLVRDEPGWRQTRLKFLARDIIDTEHKTVPFYDDGAFLVARTTNIKGGRLTLEGAKYTDLAGYEEWTRRAVPSPGDILFTREAPAGEACLVPEGVPLCLGQRTVLIRLKAAHADPSFVCWSLYGGLASRFIADLSQGSTVAHFNMPDIGNIPLFTGPVEEQQKRARALETKLEQIDSLRSHVIDHIARLREYRSSLISAAVTGQLDLSTFKRTVQ